MVANTITCAVCGLEARKLFLDGKFTLSVDIEMMEESCTEETFSMSQFTSRGDGGRDRAWRATAMNCQQRHNAFRYCALPAWKAATSAPLHDRARRVSGILSLSHAAMSSPSIVLHRSRSGVPGGLCLHSSFASRHFS